MGIGIDDVLRLKWVGIFLLIPLIVCFLRDLNDLSPKGCSQ